MTTGGAQTEKQRENQNHLASTSAAQCWISSRRESVCTQKPATAQPGSYLPTVFSDSAQATQVGGEERRGDRQRDGNRERESEHVGPEASCTAKGNVLAGELPNIFTVIYTFICFDSLHCDSHMHLCYRRFSPGTWATVVFSCLHQIIFWLRNETIQIHKLNWSEVKWVNSCCVPGCSQIPIIPSLTFLQVGSLSCWVCCDWTSCLDAPQSCPLTGHPSCPFPVWSLHALPLGLLLYPRLAHGGLAASERFEVWLHIERESNQSG